MFMPVLDVINAVVVSLGIPTIVGVLIVIGRKLEVLDSVKKEIDNNLRPDLKDVRERMAALEGRASGLFHSHSPIHLTSKGTDVLEGSGLKKYIDTNKDMLVGACAELGNFETPYDVQQSAFDFMEEYPFPEEVENSMKEYAFNQGTSLEAVRRIAAIYFRDLCLESQGFHVEDLNGSGDEDK
jgi:hypothetical protein